MQTTSPIRIGYCLSLTGALAGNGHSARLAHDIWCEDVNRIGPRAPSACVSTKMVGGGVIGRQNTTVKTTQGPSPNGVVNDEYWMPVPGRHDAMAWRSQHEL
jgi:hypothetical protein